MGPKGWRCCPDASPAALPCTPPTACHPWAAPPTHWPLLVSAPADGSLGSRTALFHEPYADQPDTHGTRTIELGRLRQLVADADAAGLQVAVHAIGDRAVDDVLGLYADLAHSRRGSGGGGGDAAAAGSNGDAAAVPPRHPTHRIEHAQHLSGPAAARRMAEAGVAVTPNPLHLLADRSILEARLGAARAGAGHTYAFGTLRQAGVTAAFGSDWPVVELDALGALPCCG